MGVKISARLQKVISSELNGDRLVWSGMPDPRRAFRAAIPLALFGIPWTAISGVFVALAFRDWSGGKNVASGFVFLFITPFMLLGFAMLLSPIWAMRDARRTVYVVTDRRLLTIVANDAVSVKSARRDHITTIRRIERANGRGDLTVTVGTRFDSDGDKQLDTMDFHGIEQARKVEQLLQPSR